MRRDDGRSWADNRDFLAGVLIGLGCAWGGILLGWGISLVLR